MTPLCPTSTGRILVFHLCCSASVPKYTYLYFFLPKNLSTLLNKLSIDREKTVFPLNLLEFLNHKHLSNHIPDLLTNLWCPYRIVKLSLFPLNLSFSHYLHMSPCVLDLWQLNSLIKYALMLWYLDTMRIMGPNLPTVLGFEGLVTHHRYSSPYQESNTTLLHIPQVSLFSILSQFIAWPCLA